MPNSEPDATETDAAVRAQYEALPYPERDPKDERKRLLIGSPSHLAEVDHYVFGGARDWSKPFRVLVAGGGTGDATIMLAQQLADRACPAEVVYLDMSTAARRVVEARAAERGLANLTFVTGSLLDLPTLGLGLFDYIDCCGVLHHLADPAAGLAALKSVLAPGGGMGLMVYARLGRTGVYEMQEMLQVVAGAGSPRERVALGRKFLADLPPSNWLMRNGLVGDHILGGDAGFFDLLMHPRDQAYSVEEVARLVAGGGLRISQLMAPVAYDPLNYLKNPELRRRVAALDWLARAAFAEKLHGTLIRHICYVVDAYNPVTHPDPDDDGVVPLFRDMAADAVARLIGTRGVLTAKEGPVGLSFPMPRLAGVLAGLVDGRRTRAEIREALRSVAGQPLDRAAFDGLFRDVYIPLNAINQLLLRKPAG